MKVWIIAFKDIKHTFSNAFSLVMSLGAPLLITGLLFFAFGSMGADESGVNLSPASVLLADLDAGLETSGGFQAGEMLVSFLHGEGLNELMEFKTLDSEGEARAGVESGAADLAVIIPEDFTRAALELDERASVVLYQDPTLTIMPGILESLLKHFMDGFSGAKIAAGVAAGQFQSRGLSADQDTLSSISREYAAWLETSGHGGEDQESGLRIVEPSGEEQQADDTRSAMVGPIMAGMTVFFLFYMAANSSQTIITEDENGTLSRLFTTPTSRGLILAGKYLGVFLVLIVQAALLLISSHYLFGITWGKPGSVVLTTLGNITLAAGFGIFLMSLVKSTRQTGPVLGGVLTITGMLGGLFTTGIPDLPEFLDRARLIVPQGWALRAWEASLSGVGPTAAAADFLEMAGIGVVMFAVGAVVFKRRFA